MFLLLLLQEINLSEGNDENIFLDLISGETQGDQTVTGKSPSTLYFEFYGLFKPISSTLSFNM